MKIPSYRVTREPRRWLAWHLRVWAGRLDPDRPYISGPFPSTEPGLVTWVPCVSNGAAVARQFDTIASREWPR